MGRLGLFTLGDPPVPRRGGDEHGLRSRDVLLFLWIGLPYPVAAGLSLVLGVAFSFNSHRLLVFKAKGRFLRYVLVWLAIYGIDVALIALLRDHVGDYLAGIVLVPIIIVLSFVLMSRFVFKDRLEQGAS